ncbi:restriction endonuclease subunit S [Thioalkalivibrio sp. ALR17-21]|uniref:restriction endonuclease subunit S n=1 Tax=Thioalkalivibrio sp. ALR17-21 TaxID=1269813 RepID=UPI0018CAADA0|nr:restriction endonuclease subunit S [Thioalkalivibrio sp. ALR17-21]
MYKDRSAVGWDFAPLRELVDPNRRITYGIVQPGEWQEPGNGVPLIRGQDYSSGDVAIENLRYVHDNIASKYTRSTVKEGDILLSIVGYVGLCAIVPKSAEGANITQTTARVSPSGNIHSGYLAHYFRSQDFKEEVKRYTKGSAQPGLNLDDVEKMVVRKPQALGEQITIASILDTLDTQIQKTEALIAKLEKVKEGLLHDLLTRGIDENGQLRPSPGQAPELYKESQLGLIPREWKAGYLIDCVVKASGIKPGPFGSSITKDSYTEKGFKIYGQEQVISENQDYGNYFISGRKFQELSEFSVKKGDVLISLVGTIGRSLLIQDGYKEGVINPRLMRIRVNCDIALPSFVAELIKSKPFSRRLVALAGGGTMPVINKGAISRVAIPLVPLNEQEEISRRIMSIKNRIYSESHLHSKLLAKKAGLMDDLLTGRVRVTPLLKQTQAATPA